MLFVVKQNNQKGLIPTNRISPNSYSLKKVFYSKTKGIVP